MRTWHSSRLGLVYTVLAVLGCGCGPDPLFVSADLGPNAKCRFVADASLSLDQSTLDIAPGAAPGSTACAGPYLAHLLVDNHNSASVAIENAQVTLMSESRLTVQFDRGRTPLPNPFLMSAKGAVPSNGKGVAAVQVIPLPYASQLDAFAGSGVLAQVELRGHTSDGDEVSSNTYGLAIEICNGCRTLCQSDPRAGTLGTQCTDPTLGADDRSVCLDPGC